VGRIRVAQDVDQWQALVVTTEIKHSAAYGYLSAESP
jgi:hypothetical protein